MTHPPEHYPIPAIQHTRCMLALTVSKAVIDLFKPDHSTGKKLNEQIAKINRWIDECSLLVREWKLSAGAKRDLDRSFEALGPHFELKTLDDGALFERWAALVWTSVFMVWDVRFTCPEFRKPACWRFLDQTLTTLAEHLWKEAPHSDAEGSLIYEEAA